MPYIRCPRCDTSTFSLAVWSHVDECPACGAPLRTATLTGEPTVLASAPAPVPRPPAPSPGQAPPLAA